jgi:elongation factor Ts
MSTDLIKQLRAMTSAGVMDCKRALDEANGNLEKAAEILRQQGLAKAEKKAGREASQGIIHSYIHAGGRIGSMIELNCETDFVARTDDFKALAHDLAMQAAAMPPRFIRLEEVTDEDKAAGISEFGDEKRFFESAVFLAQPFIKEPRRTIDDIVRDVISKVGENIVVRRVARFEVGETAADEAAEEAAAE